MTPKFFSLTILSVLVLTSGCEKEKTTSEQIDKVKAETKTAAQEMKDYTFAQKAEFTAKMQAELDGINKDLDVLASNIEKSSDAVKAEAKPKLQILRDQSAALTKHLDETRTATESTWDNVKSATRKSFDAMKESFNQARQWTSDKIAP